MKNLYLRLFFLAAAFVAVSTTQSFGQCEQWVSPTDSTGWIDFNLSFGGAPCDDGMGCPFNEITDFEVFASEAYSVDGFQMGGSYTFSMCNGVGAGSWVPEFTIIAPSGAIDAFGPGDGDACSITWTCSEDGTYLIVINEAGNCGVANSIDNGFPALTCNSGAPCAPPDPCAAGVLTTTGEALLCGATATVDVNTDDAMASIPASGGFGYVFDPALGGTGGLAGEFIFTGQDFAVTYDSDLGGVLSANAFPLMEGTWIIKGAAYEDANDPFASICSETADSIVVTFVNALPTVDVVDNGDGSATVTATGGTTPYSYEWSDGSITATISGIDMSGTYTVTVTDGFGCTVEGSVDVIGTSTTNIENLTALQIGPNPTAGELNINLSLREAQDVRIDLIDMTGRVISSTDYGTVQTQSDRMDLSSYANGVYFVRLVVGQEEMTERVLLMH